MLVPVYLFVRRTGSEDIDLQQRPQNLVTRSTFMGCHLSGDCAERANLDRFVGGNWQALVKRRLGLQNNYDFQFALLHGSPKSCKADPPGRGHSDPAEFSLHQQYFVPDQM